MRRGALPKSAGFAERLREAMRARGFVSDSAKSGIDVSALATAAGTTYEMARRYAEGNALPRPDKLERIARWLSMPASVLAWGDERDATAPLPINQEVLQQCVMAVLDAMERTKIRLPPEKVAALTAQLYTEAARGRLPEPGTLASVLRALG